MIGSKHVSSFDGVDFVAANRKRGFGGAPDSASTPETADGQATTTTSAGYQENKQTRSPVNSSQAAKGPRSAGRRRIAQNSTPQRLYRGDPGLMSNEENQHTPSLTNTTESNGGCESANQTTATQQSMRGGRRKDRGPSGEGAGVRVNEGSSSNSQSSTRNVRRRVANRLSQNHIRLLAVPTGEASTSGLGAKIWASAAAAGGRNRWVSSDEMGLEQVSSTYKVDGLTNDGVKSHLQVHFKSTNICRFITVICRNRLHTRRLPSSNTSSANQSGVGLGGELWMSPQDQYVELSKQGIYQSAATPKQIKELMQVDGLTNDGVKSHLQVHFKSTNICRFITVICRNRLHTRRLPSSNTSSANQSGVGLGGELWMSPQDQYVELSKQGIYQSGSPDGPLLIGTTGGTSTTDDNNMDDGEDTKSENYCWKGS
ncbi:Homeodomain-like protein [Artemisia annua]|uniref:Homeodomain-like protein n=1 Tax=Artemisia annua TaxID=35608 RepID=A0A2U1KLV8_ARTAN|nr:Homeodomain-like protein [Artemisia annua]